MRNELYQTIYKRKSVRKFDESLRVSQEELSAIEAELQRVTALAEGIRVKFMIVKREDTTAKWGEYCLLMYSEKQPHYLLNAGYMLEQMDLFLAAQDIGVCWYGMSKPKETQVDGLDYVIMLAFGKCRSEDFRTSPTEFRRKDREAIWEGAFAPEVVEAVRLTPSACNSQPWKIRSHSGKIEVLRSANLLSLIPTNKMPYYNSIDMGICLCFLELALNQAGQPFQRHISPKEQDKGTLVSVAEYTLG